MPTRLEQRMDHWRAEKLMRATRKEAVRNRNTDRVRRRDWLPDDPDEWDAIASPGSERVMPRGEHERRRGNLERARRQTGEAIDDAGLDGDAPADDTPADDAGNERDGRSGLGQAFLAGEPGASRSQSARGSDGKLDASAQAPNARRQSILAEPLGPDEGIVVEVSTGHCRVQTGDRLLLCTLARDAHCRRDWADQCGRGG